MRSLIDKGVEYLMPLYVDVHGIAKTKTVPVSHFDRMMRGSELFTGAALDGLGQGPHDDELAVLAGSACRDAASLAAQRRRDPRDSSPITSSPTRCAHARCWQSKSNVPPSSD